MPLNHWFSRLILLGSGTIAIALLPSPAKASLASFPKTAVVETESVGSTIEELSAQSVDLVESFRASPPSDQAQFLVSAPIDAKFTHQLKDDQLNVSEVVIPAAENLTLPGDGQATATALEIPLPSAHQPLAQVRSTNQSDEWEFLIEPYVFVPFNVTTEVSVGPVSPPPVSVGLDDIFSLDRVFSGALRLEARKPQFGFFLDGSHIFVSEGQRLLDYPLPPLLTDLLNLASPITIPQGSSLDVDLTATSRITTIDLGGYYRVVDRYLGTKATNQPTYPRLSFDPFLGVRVVLLSGGLDFRVDLGNTLLRERSLDDSLTLLKPLVGAQLGLELSDRWGLGLRGDVSGLAIGADEAFAWSVLGGARYRFSPSVALQLAYHYKDATYRAGEGLSRFGLNQSQHGLWLGFDIDL